MKNFVQRGDTIDVIAPAGGMVSGQGVQVGSLFGYAVADKAAGELGAVEVEGVVDAKKLLTDVVAVGAKLNWDDTAKQLKVAAGDLAAVATVIEAAGNGDQTVKVKLTPL